MCTSKIISDKLRCAVWFGHTVFILSYFLQVLNYDECFSALQSSVALPFQTSLSRLSSESGCDSNSLSFLSGQEHLLPLREGCCGNIKEVLRRGRGGDEHMTLVDTFPQICILTLTPPVPSREKPPVNCIYLLLTPQQCIACDRHATRLKNLVFVWFRSPFVLSYCIVSVENHIYFVEFRALFSIKCKCLLMDF